MSNGDPNENNRHTTSTSNPSQTVSLFGTFTSSPNNSQDQDSSKMDARKLMGRYLADWLFLAAGAVLYLLFELMEPFHRMFRLDDPTIQFPHAEEERVSDILCIVCDNIRKKKSNQLTLEQIIAVVVPSLAMVVSPLLSRRANRMHLIHLSLLGILTAFVFNGMLTNILKVWLGRPRPDFLSRCIPAKNTPTNKMVTVSVCTNDNLKQIRNGFKSTPSGHSSTSFAGLVYFSLWIAGQLQAFRPGVELYRPIVAFLPTVVAFYIAISRTEDYRHHYHDIIIGGLIGTVFAVFAYRRQFPSVTDSKSYAPTALPSGQSSSVPSTSASNSNSETELLARADEYV